MLCFDIIIKFLFIWAELGSLIRLGALGFFKDEPSRKPSGGNRNPNSSTQLPLPPYLNPPSTTNLLSSLQSPFFWFQRRPQFSGLDSSILLLLSSVWKFWILHLCSELFVFLIDRLVYGILWCLMNCFRFSEFIEIQQWMNFTVFWLYVWMVALMIS